MLFLHDQRGKRARYAPTCWPTPSCVRRSTFLVWVVAGLAAPFALGLLIGAPGRRAHRLLWGGAMRVLVLHT